MAFNHEIIRLSGILFSGLLMLAHALGEEQMSLREAKRQGGQKIKIP